MKVESSNIDEIGYDPDSLTLEIKFKSGGIYQYWPVTLGGWNAFLKSKSKGGFFQKHIKYNKTITYKKLDDLQADNKV